MVRRGPAATISSWPSRELNCEFRSTVGQFGAKLLKALKRIERQTFLMLGDVPEALDHHDQPLWDTLTVEGGD